MCLSWYDENNQPNANPGRPIDGCARFTGAEGEDPGYLYGLVTQTTRGEVALIDLTTENVVDLDPSKPGFNFIPVGGNPVDIVATPGGTAAFVGSAEANREGIWILPSKTIVKRTPRLTSFAACALPSPPGKMIVVDQPGPGPSKCDGEAYDPPNHDNGNLALETTDATRKIIVSLPDLGALAVIDVQEILDHPPGSFRACPIEHWVDLQANIPATVPQQRTPDGGYPPGVSADGSACVASERPEIPRESDYLPRPAGMAFDANTGKLYVADEVAPVIHVLDASSPCNLTEQSPLLPVSASRPERVVVSRDVAVSPATTTGKKYLYATDLYEGSVMVFDVSLDSTDRTPLMRPYPWRNPFQSLDRLGFSVPVKEIEFVLRDTPKADPSSGATAVGVACDPATDGSVGSLYRTNSDFSEGAGPGTLRGVFATLALTNGQIVIVDVEDFDAACRRPEKAGVCNNEKYESYQGASGELSCNLVEPHQARSSYFLQTAEDANGRVPGLQTYPVLSLDTSVLATDQTEEGLNHPKLLAPAPSEPKPDDELGSRINTELLVGGRKVEEIQTDPSTAEKNMLVFDLSEPRVHIEQDWAVTFEGPMPGFSGHVGRFDANSDETARTAFYDGGAFFCDRGVHDFRAAAAVASGLGIEDTETWANEHVDVLQITEDFLDEEDPYWDSVSGRCSWLQCRETFGLVGDPRPPRDLPIIEAYQGTLIVDRVFDFVRCCFPAMVNYTVRPQNQWLVTGGSSGFLHKVIPDADTHRCVDSCDPAKALLNGRALEHAQSEPIPKFDGPGVFRNPALQFVLWRGLVESERDMTFKFREKDGFVPLLINLAASTSFIQPQSLDLAPTGELVLADGSAQGLVFVSLGSLGVSRSFF